MNTKICHRRFSTASLLSIIVGIAMSIVSASCYSSDNYEIRVDKERLYISSSSDRGFVNIITDGQWYVSQIDPQLSVSPWKGDGHTVMSVYWDNPDNAKGDFQTMIVIKSVDDSNSTATIHVYLEGSHEYTY